MASKGAPSGLGRTKPILLKDWVLVDGPRGPELRRLLTRIEVRRWLKVEIRPKRQRRRPTRKRRNPQ